MYQQLSGHVYHPPANEKEIERGRVTEIGEERENRQGKCKQSKLISKTLFFQTYSSSNHLHAQLSELTK